MSAETEQIVRDAKAFDRRLWWRDALIFMLAIAVSASLWIQHRQGQAIQHTADRSELLRAQNQQILKDVEQQTGPDAQARTQAFLNYVYDNLRGLCAAVRATCPTPPPSTAASGRSP